MELWVNKNKGKKKMSNVGFREEVEYVASTLKYEGHTKLIDSDYLLRKLQDVKSKKTSIDKLIAEIAK